MGAKRPVDKIDRQGNVIKHYPTVKDAAEDSYVESHCVIARCNRRCLYNELMTDKVTLQEFTFRYANCQNQHDPVRVKPTGKTRKRVTLVDSNMKVVKTYRSITAASKDSGFNRTSIHRRLHGFAVHEWEQWDFSFRWEGDHRKYPYTPPRQSEQGD